MDRTESEIGCVLRMSALLIITILILLGILVQGSRTKTPSFNTNVLTADTSPKDGLGGLPVEKKDSKDQALNLELPQARGVQGSIYELVKNSNEEDSSMTRTTLRRSAKSAEGAD